MLSFSQPGPRKESPGQDEPQPCQLSTIPEILPQVEFVGLGDHQGNVPAEATLAGFDALVQKVLVGLSSGNSLYITDHPDHRTLINGLQDKGQKVDGISVVEPAVQSWSFPAAFSTLAPHSGLLLHSLHLPKKQLVDTHVCRSQSLSWASICLAGP